MRKAYTKPQIHIEKFILSQSIASCGAAHTSSLGGPNHWSKKTCGWVVGNEVYWSSVPGCGNDLDDVYPEDWDELGAVCYNNPSGGNTIFSS